MADAFDAAYAQHEDPFDRAYGPDPQADPFDRAYSRPIAALNGGVPPAPGFGDSVRIGLEQTPGFPEGTLSAIRRPLVTGLASAGGTVAGLASPVPGGAYLGGVAGGLAGDAFNNYLDGAPLSDAVSPSNVARGLLYGTMRGRLLADTAKLAGGNAVIDAFSGEPMSLGRTAAQTAPALIAPGLRTAGTIGRFARDAKADGLTVAKDKFLGTYKTPEQQALVDEMPKLFPTRPTINVRGTQDFLDEAGIQRGTSDVSLPEPARRGTIRLAQEKMSPELRAGIGFLGGRSNPASREAGQRLRLYNDMKREYSVTGKQITSEVMDRLSAEEQDQLHRYMIWRDMDQKNLWSDEVKLAAQLKDAGDPGYESLLSTLDADKAREWDVYDAFRGLETSTPDRVKAAVAEIRDRLLSRMDRANLTIGTKTYDPMSGEVRDYKSYGEEYYPRIGRAVRETEDPWRTAIERGDLSPTEAAARQMSGGSPPTTEVGRQDWLYSSDRFEPTPQKTLDDYVDEQAKRLALTAAFGAPAGGAEGQTGTEMLRIIADLTKNGHTLDKKVLLRTLGSIYSPRHQENEVVGFIKRGVSNLALAKSALTQIPQAANNFSIAGFGNTLKGMLAQRSEAAKFRLSAANDPALRKYYEEAGQLGTDTLTGKAVGVVEQGWNRSNSAVGYGPHLRSLGQESLGHLEAGTEYPARLVREAQFYGTTPETLAKQTRLFGEPSWVRPMRQAIDKAQFHAEVGDVPEGMRTGPMSLLMTYKAFPYKQAGFFKNQIASPMLSGNMEEFDMGLERAVRLVSGLTALGVPIKLAKDLIAGRDLSSPEQLAAGTAEDAMGLLAAPLNVGASMVAGSPLDTRAAERSVIPAPVSVAASTGRDLAAAWNGGVQGDMDPVAKVLLKDILPILNLSGTGLEGLLGPPAYKYLVEAPR